MKMVKRKKIKSRNVIRLLIAVFLIILGGQSALAQEDYVPLNLSQVETALRSTKATPAVKNSVLIKGIGERKITFWLTPENEKKLRFWGANEALIKAVRENAPPTFPMLLPNSKTFKDALGIELVLIPRGEFLMGLAEGDFGDFNERPQHNVKIADDYYIAKYEVTQGQWKAVFGKNPSFFDKCGDDCPVENVSWETVQKFIAKLNEKNDGYIYRLPSEAEWEYAARAGIKTPFFWGKDDESKAWQFSVHADNQGPTKVGSYLPNAFGLYDMIGNIWEYCDDVWRDNAQKPTDSGLPNQIGEKDRRTMKGGGFHQFTSDLRLSRRAFVSAKDPHYTQGFRLAATPRK